MSFWQRKFQILMKVWQILTKSSNLVTDEILNFDEICNFGECRNLNFDKIWKFGNFHQNLITNLDRSRSQLSKNTKIVKFGQISLHKIEILNITNFVGSRFQDCAFGTISIILNALPAIEFEHGLEVAQDFFLFAQNSLQKFGPAIAGNWSIPEWPLRKTFPFLLGLTNTSCGETNLKIFVYETFEYSSGALFCSAGQWGLEVKRLFFLHNFEFKFQIKLNFTKFANFVTKAFLFFTNFVGFRWCCTVFLKNLGAKPPTRRRRTSFLCRITGLLRIVYSI